MNGLRTSNGVNIDALTIINNQLDLDKINKKWPQLIIHNSHLKLENNDFMLLDEISSELFL